jgi:hypothetical protein
MGPLNVPQKRSEARDLCLLGLPHWWCIPGLFRQDPPEENSTHGGRGVGLAKPVGG